MVPDDANEAIAFGPVAPAAQLPAAPLGCRLHLVRRFVPGIGRQDDLPRRPDGSLGNAIERSLAVGIEAAQRLDLIPEPLHPERLGGLRRPEIEDPPAPRELPFLGDR